MAKWAIQNILSSQYVHYYENETPGVPTEYGGPWGDPDTHLHVENQEEAYEADLASAKTKRIDEINQECHALMGSSDWMAIREAETAVAVPASWTTYRDDMRTEANTCVAAINSLVSINACRDYTATWPVKP